MVLLHTPPGELGAPAADFNLPGTDGRQHTLSEYQEAPVLVMMFICNHCPYVLAVESRLIDLAKQLAPRHVAFVAISSNDAHTYPDDSFEKMQQRAREQGYPFDYLYDEDQSVAQAYGAICTPDFFVYDAERKLRYRGRLDDSPRNKAAVTRREMYAAIVAMLDNTPIPEPQNPSMGCSIKWKEGNG